MPRLGNDGISDIVVFTSREVDPDGILQQGDIYYQRLTPSGEPLGAPVQVTSGPTDDELDDISGDNIVYTAYVSTSSMAGRIMLYRISTGTSYIIASAAEIQEPRICGNKVVWREGDPAAAQVMLYDLWWLGTDQTAVVLAGPSPSTFSVDIGDRFVVWNEWHDDYSQHDVIAYDLLHGTRLDVTDTLNINDREPSTDGPWIVWQSQVKGATSIQILAKNMDTGETRVVADNGAWNYRPSISGDIICYESYKDGNLNIYAYYLSSSVTYPVTADTSDQYFNDVFGNKVAYDDYRGGNLNIYLSWLNFLPLADAGEDVTVLHGSTVALDGSGSTDPDGNLPLQYEWSILSKPVGSASAITDPTSVAAALTTDVPGEYAVQLAVTDSEGSVGYDTMCILATNNVPVAEAGLDQAVTLVGTTVFLDGSQSYDPDGDSISYTWYFVSKPAGSATTMTGAYTATPSFVADVNGEYFIELIVADSWGYHIDGMKVSFENLKPVADAGLSRTVRVGDVVDLDGSGSYDANGDSLTYSWSIDSWPSGSSAAIVDPTAMTTSFTPDVTGTFVVMLMVNDGLESSEGCYINIQVLASESEVIDAVEDIQDIIITLDPGALKNENMQNAMMNKLNEAIANIQAGEYAVALGQLQNDILAKTDGCATSGAPDKNDWITTCEEQAIVYSQVLDTIELVQLLMG